MSTRPVAISGIAMPDRPLTVAEYLEIGEDIDVDLQLVPADQPGTVRRPDVIVARRAATARVDREGEVYHASDVVLAVEVVSPGSQRLDRRVKRDEYADAGIPQTWMSRSHWWPATSPASSAL